MIVPYLVHILILIGIYLIVITSLNLALGYSGLLNLGHVALFGVGAYTSTLLVLRGVPFFVAFLAAGLLASFFGFFLVFATKKLRGDYYALASLGFAFVIHSLLLNLVGITRGPLGIPGIPRSAFFGFVLEENLLYLLFVSGIALVSLFVLFRIVRSGFGTLLAAMRDDEVGLRMFGVNTKRLKYITMGISAFFVGIAGSLLAHYLGYIDPNIFSIHELILILSIVIVGGLASFKGSILATFVIILLAELMRFVPLPSSIIGPGRQILYGLVLLFILMKRPRGLYGGVDLHD